MAYFAELNENNVVSRVVIINNDILMTGIMESEELGIRFCKNLYGENTNWVQTSYTGKIRKQFASKDYFYDKGNDVFIKPQPYASWVLDDNFDWHSPIPYPDNNNFYDWNEEQQTWDLIVQ